MALNLIAAELQRFGEIRTVCYGASRRPADAQPLGHSIVISLVDGNVAALPIGRSFDPLLVQSALVDEMPAQGFGGRGFRRHPSVAFPFRE